MVSFRKRYAAVTAFIALAGIFLCGDVAAQAMTSLFKKQSASRKRTDAPTVVEAATMDIDMEHNMATLLGNVIVDDQDVKITCNKMIIYLADKAKASEADENKNSKKKAEEDDPTEGKDLDKIECYGEVVILRRPDPNDKNAKEQVSTSDFAVYDVRRNSIILTGSPVLTSGKDRLDAEKLIIDTVTGRTKIITGRGTYYGDSLSSPGKK